MKARSCGCKVFAININVVFVFFFLVYVGFILHSTTLHENERRSSVKTDIACSSFNDCRPMKVSENNIGFWKNLPYNARIAVINMESEEWPDEADIVEEVQFDRVSRNLTWERLFPEWIDEEEEFQAPTCPEIPMPDFGEHEEVDLVATTIPCIHIEAKLLTRDVSKLQINLVAANMALRRGKRDVNGKVRLVFKGNCAPMMEIFRCDDMVGRRGEWRLYEVDIRRLEEKVVMPVGSCKLATPLTRRLEEDYDEDDLDEEAIAKKAREEESSEAYATVIHSSDRYVCGAISLAQSLLLTGTRRHLLLLHDSTIPSRARSALAAAGWRLRLVSRISNPHGSPDSYNLYNYTKLRLWLLLRYRKVVFVDADVLVLKNLDLLFRLPQLSAVGNDQVLFNSGVMVVEPSKCMFNHLMAMRHSIVPYNGGDQGFLNEVFVWWHRLPKSVNFVKNVWSNTTEEVQLKDKLYAADPPKLYTIHFLGMKPWTCYRDYDCNWNLVDHHLFASDAAHSQWWKIYDSMKPELQSFCRLTPGRKTSLEKHWNQAKAEQLKDGHWRIPITDPRA